MTNPAFIASVSLEPWLTKSEIAHKLGISTRTVVRLRLPHKSDAVSRERVGASSVRRAVPVLARSSLRLYSRRSSHFSATSAAATRP